MTFWSFDRLIALTSIGLGVATILQPERSILGFVPFDAYLMALSFIVPSLYLFKRKVVSYAVFLVCTTPFLLYLLLFVFAYSEALLLGIRSPSLAIAWAFLMFYALIQYVKSEMREKDEV